MTVDEPVNVWRNFSKVLHDPFINICIGQRKNIMDNLLLFIILYHQKKHLNKNGNYIGEYQIEAAPVMCDS